MKTTISLLATLNSRVCFVNKIEWEHDDRQANPHVGMVDGTMGRPTDSCHVSLKSKYISITKSE